jgi:hypothetical protein
MVYYAVHMPMLLQHPPCLLLRHRLPACALSLPAAYANAHVVYVQDKLVRPIVTVHEPGTAAYHFVQ